MDAQAAWLTVALLSMPIAALTAAFVATGSAWKRTYWIALCLIFPPAVIWLLARRGRTEEPTPSDEWLRVAPRPVEAPEEDDDLAGVPEPVTACPDCGYLGIRPPGVQDGVYPGGGELILQVCPRCNYRGLPLRFEQREDYADFLRTLSENRAWVTRT